jgi:hypothetical protein
MVWYTDQWSVTISGDDGGRAMSASEQSQIRTRMFARVLGPFLTIVPTTVAVRGSYMQTLFTEFKANPMWPWLYGAFS